MKHGHFVAAIVGTAHSEGSYCLIKRAMKFLRMNREGIARRESVHIVRYITAKNRHEQFVIHQRIYDEPVRESRIDGSCGFGPMDARDDSGSPIEPDPHAVQCIRDEQRINHRLWARR